MRKIGTTSRSEGKEFQFGFNASNDQWKKKPFVARLTWMDGRLNKEFFDLDRVTEGKSYTVSGQYTARAGDIIEKREKASLNRDYRYWYLITEEGEEIKVADVESTSQKNQVVKYLKGELPATKFITE